MKKMITAAVAASLITGVALAEVSTTFDFASAYVFRGYTFNDGPVLQPGIEASGLGLPEEYGSAVVGMWGNINFDDYNGSDFSSEFSEIDVYALYSLPTLIEGVDLSLGYTEYTYPLGGEADKEVSASAGYTIADVALGAAIYRLVGGAYVGDTWYEVSAGYDIELAEDLSASLAADVRFVDSVDGESGFNDYTLGASVGYALNEVWSAGLGLTYIGQGDDEVLADGVGNYDVDFVGMLSLGATY